jgi:hypothetical protein
MALAALGLRQLILPQHWGAAARLAVLVPFGAAIYLVATWSVAPAPLRLLGAFFAGIAHPAAAAGAAADAHPAAEAE